MPPLRPWMRFVLGFAAVYNLLAGFGMLVFYHEAYKLMGLAAPDVKMPLQLVGILVALFGVGYWLVASNPLENRNLLLLGFLSKLLGSLLAIHYVAVLGKLPWSLLVVVFFADVIYLPPFYVILRRLYRLAGERGAARAAS